MSKTEILDKVTNKWVSRKLTVFVVASIGLFSGHIDSSDWVVIASGYIAIEGFANIVALIYKAKTNQ